MSTSPRPRRAILYMPGGNARAIDKARALPIDGVILDLEDAVAPEAKAETRDLALAEIAKGGFGRREVVLRINGMDTLWFEDDLKAASHSGADAILVPKISRETEIAELDRRLVALGAPADLKLWAMMETPDAIFWSRSIVAASPRLQVLVMGTNDLIKELGVAPQKDRQPLMTALQMCVLAARAGKLAILDGVYNDIADAEGFAAECRQGQALGFDGKTLIHPAQVDPCLAVFQPSAAEIAKAKALIAAFEEARAAGKGVVQHEGRMVESLHVEQARRILALAGGV